MSETELLEQVAAYLAKQAYPEAIAQCETLLNDAPNCWTAYWFLGLAHLLQGQEEEAQFIWAAALAEAPGAEMDVLIEELSQLLHTTAYQYEAQSNWKTAWLIRQHLREINPQQGANQVQLALLGLELETLTPEDVTALTTTLEQTLPFGIDSPVDHGPLLAVLRQMLEKLPLQPEVVHLVEVCAPSISPDLLVDVVMPVVHRLKLKRQNLGVAYRYASLCLNRMPDRTDVLAALCAIAQDDRRYDEGIALARRYYATCKTLPEQILGNAYVLRGLMNTGTRWPEATTALTLETELLRTLAAEFRPTRDRILTSRILCSPLFYYPYFEDNPEIVRPLMNQVMALYQEGINLQLQQMEDYRPASAVAAWEVMSPSNGELSSSQSSSSQSSSLQAPDATTRRQRKLRIGYLSRFLYRHSVGWLGRWVMEYANRDRIEPFLYLTEQTELSPFTRRWFVENVTLARQFLPGDSAEAIAKAIRGDEIDILVDLDSLTSELSCHILALKPAPIQLTWLGLDASGLPTIDYYLADPYLLPEAAQAYYRERIWRMPQTYIAVSGFEVGVPTLRRDDLDIPADAVVYLTSQFAYKRHPRMMKAQLQILRQVPQSYLLIKGLGAEAEMQAAFSAVATDVGVDPARLRFLPRDPNEETHRANLAIADVVLDTFPYNGATTTLETLWMGIPLVTRVGNQCAARTSYTMMRNAGLEEGMAHTEQEYIDWGVRLGTDPALRQRVSQTLLRSRQTAPLWNARQFTRDLEAAYEQMVEAQTKAAC